MSCNDWTYLEKSDQRSVISDPKRKTSRLKTRGLRRPLQCHTLLFLQECGNGRKEKGWRKFRAPEEREIAKECASD
jgi:hypothetical protein